MWLALWLAKLRLLWPEKRTGAGPRYWASARPWPLNSRKYPFTRTLALSPIAPIGGSHAVVFLAGASTSSQDTPDLPFLHYSGGQWRLRAPGRHARRADQGDCHEQLRRGRPAPVRHDAGSQGNRAGNRFLVILSWPHRQTCRLALGRAHGPACRSRRG